VAELYLLAVSSSQHRKGLGSAIVRSLQARYKSVLTFADLRATEFFAKHGFKPISEVEFSRPRSEILSLLTKCTKATPMIWCSEWSRLSEILSECFPSVRNNLSSAAGSFCARC
jgi:N-acetylglutamate synthase-like GNAT family acetyltransferase